MTSKYIYTTMLWELESPGVPNFFFFFYDSTFSGHQPATFLPYYKQNIFEGGNKVEEIRDLYRGKMGQK